MLITASPDSTAERTGWVSIAHDGQGGISTVELRGAAGALLPRLVATIKSVDLGTVGLGEVITSGWVAFVNQGPGPLSWNLPSTGDAVFSAAQSDCAAGTTMAMDAGAAMTIVEALIEALWQRGVRRVYGVPGDYVLSLFARLEASPIAVICPAGGPCSCLIPWPAPMRRARRCS